MPSTKTNKQPNQTLSVTEAELEFTITLLSVEHSAFLKEKKEKGRLPTNIFPRHEDKDLAGLKIACLQDIKNSHEIVYSETFNNFCFHLWSHIFIKKKRSKVHLLEYLRNQELFGALSSKY